MDPALLTMGAGLRAQMESLELLSNNIANATTTGYKSDSEFYRLFATAQADSVPGGGQALWMPIVEGSVIDFQQGPFVSTDAPLDVALAGRGFLQVEAPAGVLFTRDGNLTLSPEGRLVTSEGFAVLDTQGRPIDLPPQGAVDIGADGAISVEGVRLAQLGVVEFEGHPPLIKAGNNYFQSVSEQPPRPAAETMVHQGKLEGSNVNAPESAVRLMLAARNFEMFRKVATLVGDELNGSAVEELGRTS